MLAWSWPWCATSTLTCYIPHQQDVKHMWRNYVGRIYVASPPAEQQHHDPMVRVDIRFGSPIFRPRNRTGYAATQSANGLWSPLCAEQICPHREAVTTYCLSRLASRRIRIVRALVSRFLFGLFGVVRTLQRMRLPHPQTSRAFSQSYSAEALLNMFPHFAATVGSLCDGFGTLRSQ